MTAQNLTPKQKEAKLLQELLELDGYFAEKFKEDIPEMIGNIEKDFPIENETSIEKLEFTVGELNSKISKLEDDLERRTEELHHYQKALQNQLSFSQRVLEKAILDGDTSITGMFDQKQVIETKLRLNSELTESERELLISLL